MMDKDQGGREPVGEGALPGSPFPERTEVTWGEVRLWERRGLDFLLVDVREDWERAAGHAGGLWIPLAELHGRLAEIRQGIPVAFYCRKGVRSLLAVQRFRSRLGGVPVYSVEGLEGKGS